MTVEALLEQINNHPQSIEFSDVIATIEANYTVSPSAFSVGSHHNDEGTNLGSLKVFTFAKANQLSTESTLTLFGQYYRDDVLKNPDGTDHQNIRNLIKSGIDSVIIADS